MSAPFATAHLGQRKPGGEASVDALTGRNAEHPIVWAGGAGQQRLLPHDGLAAPLVKW
ncbi:hypothetical protein V1J52_16545 [Streptomyces sp. TRM 70351]|uniref:hypothetical protein n=1 Tax=Streptomyces sp. TRM 70351 TaxID=3116552 RepID=UPI002E7BAF2B|nr:hypothetical protein [Streptomyces sp. TRM 70351]MEE1929777.1 hypothetical protein [Streptomyces sp. TRM 70351]